MKVMAEMANCLFLKESKKSSRESVLVPLTDMAGLTLAWPFQALAT